MSKKLTEQQRTINRQQAACNRVAKKSIRKAFKEGAAESVIKKAQVLFSKREHYETETLARSNKELYGILAEVLALYYEAFEDKSLADTLKLMKAALIERGMRVQNNTTALNVFVRFVFNSERKRTYNYVCTLMAALQANILPTQLAEFIEGKHGVEECKRSVSMKDETVKRKAAVADASVQVLELLRDMPAAEVIKLNGTQASLAEGTDYAFVIARKTAGGKLELLRTVPVTTKGMQSAAVKALAEDLIAKQEQVVKSAKKVKVQTATAAAKAGMTMKELETA